MDYFVNTTEPINNYEEIISDVLVEENPEDVEDIDWTDLPAIGWYMSSTGSTTKIHDIQWRYLTESVFTNI